ncbi:hypothetical protein GBO34_00930 [Roseivirga pacifica]|uniref:hypothetical protein n=1 Tax=Roseivirga pacifica TaxID=1267423 RepID=UPI0020954DA8|nr:hypothetical protein [Roseivirga pacifica]MCO6367877.1 hypothetical protein [Roseivirga pacifica]MCO6377249.1 hypothetical protein [Roseivirga pacifica]
MIYKPTVQSFIKEVNGKVYINNLWRSSGEDMVFDVLATAFNDEGQPVCYQFENSRCPLNAERPRINAEEQKAEHSRALLHRFIEKHKLPVSRGVISTRPIPGVAPKFIQEKVLKNERTTA